MINETLILHSPPHTCYIHIIHKLQNTSSILWKKFCTARLIEFKYLWPLRKLQRYFRKKWDVFWLNATNSQDMGPTGHERLAACIQKHRIPTSYFKPFRVKRPFQTSLNMKSLATRCRCDIKTMFSHTEGW